MPLLTLFSFPHTLCFVYVGNPVEATNIVAGKNMSRLLCMEIMSICNRLLSYWSDCFGSNAAFFEMLSLQPNGKIF